MNSSAIALEACEILVRAHQQRLATLFDQQPGSALAERTLAELKIRLFSRVLRAARASSCEAREVAATGGASMLDELLATTLPERVAEAWRAKLLPAVLKRGVHTFHGGRSSMCRSKHSDLRSEVAGSRTPSEDPRCECWSLLSTATWIAVDAVIRGQRVPQVGSVVSDAVRQMRTAAGRLAKPELFAARIVSLACANGAALEPSTEAMLTDLLFYLHGWDDVVSEDVFMARMAARHLSSHEAGEDARVRIGLVVEAARRSSPSAAGSVEKNVDRLWAERFAAGPDGDVATDGPSRSPRRRNRTTPNPCAVEPEYLGEMAVAHHILLDVVSAVRRGVSAQRALAEALDRQRHLAVDEPELAAVLDTLRRCPKRLNEVIRKAREHDLFESRAASAVSSVRASHIRQNQA